MPSRLCSSASMMRRLLACVCFCVVAMAAVAVATDESAIDEGSADPAASPLERVLLEVLADVARARDRQPACAAPAGDYTFVFSPAADARAFAAQWLHVAALLELELASWRTQIPVPPQRDATTTGDAAADENAVAQTVHFDVVAALAGDQSSGVTPGPGRLLPLCPPQQLTVLKEALEAAQRAACTLPAPLRTCSSQAMEGLAPSAYHLTVVNDSPNVTFHCFWANYDGKVEHYGTVLPGEVFETRTYDRHVWRFTPARKGDAPSRSVVSKARDGAARRYELSELPTVPPEESEDATAGLAAERVLDALSLLWSRAVMQPSRRLSLDDRAMALLHWARSTIRRDIGE